MVSLGEGWHHSHHAFPTSARHGLNREAARPVLRGHQDAREARPRLERQAAQAGADRGEEARGSGPDPRVGWRACMTPSSCSPPRPTATATPRLDALRARWPDLSREEQAALTPVAQLLARRIAPAPSRRRRATPPPPPRDAAPPEQAAAAARRCPARGRRDARGAARAVRARAVPPGPARGGRRRARRPRQPRRHADRRRQEPLLPAAGDRVGRADGDRQPADRAHARPVRAPDGPRPPRGDARLGPGRGQPRRARAASATGARRSSSPRPSASPRARSAPRSHAAGSRCSWSTRRTA